MCCPMTVGCAACAVRCYAVCNCAACAAVQCATVQMSSLSYGYVQKKCSPMTPINQSCSEID